LLQLGFVYLRSELSSAPQVTSTACLPTLRPLLAKDVECFFLSFYCLYIDDHKTPSIFSCRASATNFDSQDLDIHDKSWIRRTQEQASRLRPTSMHNVIIQLPRPPRQVNTGTKPSPQFSLHNFIDKLSYLIVDWCCNQMCNVTNRI
jgi:hypothetical protein